MGSDKVKNAGVSLSFQLWSQLRLIDATCQNFKTFKMKGCAIPHGNPIINVASPRDGRESSVRSPGAMMVCSGLCQISVPPK